MKTLSSDVAEQCDCGMIRGFTITVKSPYAQFRAARDVSWKRHKIALFTNAEFGNSPIRDLKARREYMETLDWHGLEYVVHPIM